jgi:hypothetical protein
VIAIVTKRIACLLAIGVVTSGVLWAAYQFIPSASWFVENLLDGTFTPDFIPKNAVTEYLYSAGSAVGGGYLWVWNKIFSRGGSLKKIKTKANDNEWLKSIIAHTTNIDDYVKNNAVITKGTLIAIKEHCKKYVEDRRSVNIAVLNHFNEGELAYDKIVGILDGLDDTFLNIIHSLTLALVTFNEKKSLQNLKKKKKEETYSGYKEVYDSFVNRIKSPVGHLDNIILKMEQLNLQLADLSSFDVDDVNNLSSVQEINALIGQLHLYKV